MIDFIKIKVTIQFVMIEKKVHMYNIIIKHRSYDINIFYV